MRSLMDLVQYDNQDVRLGVVPPNEKVDFSSLMSQFFEAGHSVFGETYFYTHKNEFTNYAINNCYHQLTCF